MVRKQRFSEFFHRRLLARRQHERAFGIAFRSAKVALTALTSWRSFLRLGTNWSAPLSATVPPSRE